MEDPYEAARPERQFTMVMDTNKCIACQSCTIACKSTWTWGKGQEYMLWNNIETKPYGFYPTGWDVNILELLGEQEWEGDVYSGETIFEAAPEGERVLGWAPAEEDWSHPNIGEDEPTGNAADTTYIPDNPHSMMWMYYLQRICNHCTYPACVAACPREAIYKRPEDGIVLVDQTHCTTSCIGRLRLTNYLSAPDEVDPRKPADFFVHIRKIALPIYPQLGLEPNVYYIPPIHVPAKYLTQMFGPGVEKAVEMYRNAKDDPELLGLLMLFGATERIMHTWDVTGGVARAYDEEGEEIVAVPLREPTFVRPFEFATEVAGEPTTGYRHNT